MFNDLKLGFVSAVLCLMSVTSWGAHAESVGLRIERNVTTARASMLLAERTLFAADQAINAASIITSSVRVNRLVHTELNRIVQGIPGARALLVIDEKGKLLHDSYKYPVLPLDLSDRNYFKEALSTDGIVIGVQVIGRTSGAPFVPIAKRIGELTFVVVISPYVLVDLQNECGDCWSSAVRKSDNNIITMFPPEGDLVPGLVLQLKPHLKNKDTGSLVVRYKHSVFSVVWTKSAEFPLLNISVRGLTDSAAVEIDIN